MKKYTLLIITITMILLTFISHMYNNYLTEIPTIPLPNTHIRTSKFGEIKEILWMNNYVSGDAALLILSGQEKQGIDYSSLFYLNIHDGHTMLLSEFPSHKNLDHVILFDNTFSSRDIIIPYKEGIVKVTLHKNNDEDLMVDSDMIAVEGFENANSVDYKGQLFFSTSEDKLLHKKNFHSGSFFSMFDAPSDPEYMTFYRNPYDIVNANWLDRVLTYTSVNKNRVHLYSMSFDGMPVTKFNLPLIQNIIMAKSIDDSYGFIGMKASDKKNLLNIFMVRRSIDRAKDLHILDSIPFNTDIFGGIPSIDSTTFNEYYTLTYTCYDENHQGQLKVSRYNEEPKVIIGDENIFGPVRITQKTLSDEKIELILYFTSEEDGIKVKISDGEGNLVKDITDMIIKSQRDVSL